MASRRACDVRGGRVVTSTKEDHKKERTQKRKNAKKEKRNKETAQQRKSATKEECNKGRA